MLSQIENRKTQIYNINGKSSDVKVRAYNFSLAIIALVNTLPNQRSYWIIADQLIRAATSIGANMIEGQAGSSKKDFVKYYEIALKSANETRYWLSLLKDCYPEGRSVSEKLLNEATEISNMLGASVLTLKGKRNI